MLPASLVSLLSSVDCESLSVRVDQEWMLIAQRELVPVAPVVDRTFVDINAVKYRDPDASCLPAAPKRAPKAAPKATPAPKRAPKAAPKATPAPKRAPKASKGPGIIKAGSKGTTRARKSA